MVSNIVQHSNGKINKSYPFRSQKNWISTKIYWEEKYSRNLWQKINKKKFIWNVNNDGVNMRIKFDGISKKLPKNNEKKKQTAKTNCNQRCSRLCGMGNCSHNGLITTTQQQNEDERKKDDEIPTEHSVLCASRFTHLYCLTLRLLRAVSPWQLSSPGHRDTPHLK